MEHLGVDLGLGSDVGVGSPPRSLRLGHSEERADRVLTGVFRRSGGLALVQGSLWPASTRAYAFSHGRALVGLAADWYGDGVARSLFFAEAGLFEILSRLYT